MSLVARSISAALASTTTLSVQVLLVADSVLSEETIRAVFPIDFSGTNVQIVANLTRSSLDFVTVFGGGRVLKLPLLADIFDVAYRHGSGDFIVFTNSDIIPAPEFYEFVARRLESMHPRHGPSLDITRRDIKADAGSIDLKELHSMPGLPHPGRDCWVFPRRWIPKLSLSHLFIAFRYAEPLLINLHYLSRHHLFKAHQQVTDAFVTRHLMHPGANTRGRQLSYSLRDEYSRVQSILGLYRRYGDDFVTHSANSSLAPFAKAVRGLLAGARLKSEKDADLYFYKLTVINQSILLF